MNRFFDVNWVFGVRRTRKNKGCNRNRISLRGEQLEARSMMTVDCTHSDTLRYDVNNDTWVDVQDILEVIHAVSNPDPLAHSERGKDVNGDTFVDVQDILWIVYELNLYGAHQMVPLCTNAVSITFGSQPDTVAIGATGHVFGTLASFMNSGTTDVRNISFMATMADEIGTPDTPHNFLRNIQLRSQSGQIVGASLAYANAEAAVYTFTNLRLNNGDNWQLRGDVQNVGSTLNPGEQFQFTMFGQRYSPEDTVYVPGLGHTTDFRLLADDLDGDTFDLTPTGEMSGSYHTAVYPDGLLADIYNRNSDANGTSVPTGVTAFGGYGFASAAHSEDGVTRDQLGGFMFDVYADNVQINASAFYVYNKADASQKWQCQALASDWATVLTGPVTGQFHVGCAGLGDSGINALLLPGETITLVLEGVVENAQKIAGQRSSLQAVLNVDEFFLHYDPDAPVFSPLSISGIAHKRIESTLYISG